MKTSRLALSSLLSLAACSPSNSSDPLGSGGGTSTGGVAQSGTGGEGVGAQPGSGGTDVVGSGGQMATGAQPGSGGAGTGASEGSGGDGTGAAASGGGPGGGDCASLFICDDFESTAASMPPDPGTWSVELGWANDQMQAAKVQVTSEAAHSGSQSVKIDLGDGPFNFYAAPPSETFYTRAWMKMVSPSGDGTLQAVGPNHSDSEIRFRLQAGKVTLNSAGGDGLAPEPTTCTDCIATPTDWFCVEMFYDGATESATLWIGGEQAAQVTNNTGWHSSGHFGDMAEKVWFGRLWHQGTAPITYIDDVAVDTSRIGCD